MRLHITGASGSGTSTLGLALAAQRRAPFIETDDIHWKPSDPPFQVVRSAQERRALLLAAFARHPDCVVSGSVNAWGAEVEDAFDGIVFLYVGTALRVERVAVPEFSCHTHFRSRPPRQQPQKFLLLTSQWIRHDTRTMGCEP